MVSCSFIMASNLSSMTLVILNVLIFIDWSDRSVKFSSVLIFPFTLSAYSLF